MHHRPGDRPARGPESDRVRPPVLEAVDRLLADPRRAARVLHVERLPGREAVHDPWPAWVAPHVVSAYAAAGVRQPWRHQVQAAEAAWRGEDVVVATGTASGKSLAYLMPALTHVLAGRTAPNGRGATTLYLAPTKALAADQAATLQALGVIGVRTATYDGDTPLDERRWIRDHASYVLTNPDLVHHSLLPGHDRWSSFLRSLAVVVVDECHHYRGIFGSHVSAVLRRLLRVAARYGATPVVVLASATSADPAVTAGRLTGRDAVAVTEDTSPHGPTTFLLLEPPLLPGGGERGAPTRRSATAESADLFTELVAGGVRTLVFARSRRGVEAVAASARRALADVDPSLVERVAAYRGGYLPEERRALEQRLRSGDLLGLATTNALEMGIDIQGLDAVVLAGWPGTRASLWQQAGRAGRQGEASVAALVARDDPLDTYLVHHPSALFGQGVEATVLDPDNPRVLAPHLCAAAAELPLREQDLPIFGPAAGDVVAALTTAGWLRRRPAGWYWTRPSRPGDLADLRGTGGEPVRLVEDDTGRVLGTVDAGSAHHSVHAGAVYLHQGAAFLVLHLDLDGGVALLEPADGDVTTQARDVSDIRVTGRRRRRSWGDVELALGTVEVSSTVVGYLRRDVVSGQVLGEHPLVMPTRRLATQAVWWTMPPHVLASAGVDALRTLGSLHAAEHAAIGLLPLVATCDRWDIGGVSTALHPDTGLPTVFVHDGQQGGAGFAERGYDAAADWLGATRAAVASCECISGCPSCVQSPKCGNGNQPLDKAGAVAVLDVVLAGAGAG